MERDGNNVNKEWFRLNKTVTYSNIFLLFFYLIVLAQLLSGIIFRKSESALLTYYKNKHADRFIRWGF